MLFQPSGGRREKSGLEQLLEQQDSDLAQLSAANTQQIDLAELRAAAPVARNVEVRQSAWARLVCYLRGLR